MARTATRLSLRNQAYQRADTESATDRFPTAEVDEYINQSYTELYDLLCDSEQDYFLTSTSVSIVASTETYSLPSDFYRIRGVDITINGSALYVSRWKFEERRNYFSQTNVAWGYESPVAYHLTGQNIQFKPTPAIDVDATLWYYPAPPRMTDDAHTIDGVAGWEEFVVLGAAIKMLAKDNRDAALLLAERDRQEMRIISQATRSDDIPDRVTRRRNTRGQIPGFR